MKSLLSFLLTFSLVITSLLGEGARADSGAFPYTAYRKAGRGSWNRAWTPTLLTAIRQNWAAFSSAKDVETYCPGFRGVNRNLQEECMVRLLTGITSWESGNTPSAVGDNGRSNGLLQLNKNLCVKDGYNETDLRTAEKNLRCGVRFAASRVAHDHVIAQEEVVTGRWGTPRTVRHGLGKMAWSTMMREKYVNLGRSQRQVGRLSQIAAGMATYRDPRAGSLAVLDLRRKRIAAGGGIA